MDKVVRLTQFSHGAGCGCKISPKDLEEILSGGNQQISDSNLWVGNSSRDDAAIYALDDHQGVVSTADFFMPIVDDPFDFGRIAAANAISDIYAMGADPLMAIAILGWPVSLLPLSAAREVMRGGIVTCKAAGIPLAGGHSVESLEPFFGLSVTGVVKEKFIKRNDTARVGDTLYLTKALGVGVLTTAEKISMLRAEDAGIARDSMCILNSSGSHFGKLVGVSAMTDVTGFGLLGHLIEMADASGLTVHLNYSAIPRLQGVDYYLAKGCVPGGTLRNFESYGAKVSRLTEMQRDLLCDPQTSGGLLIAVTRRGQAEFLTTAAKLGLQLSSIGDLVARQDKTVLVY